MDEKQKPLMLDKAPFPITQIDYANGSTLRTIRKLQEQLGKLKKVIQG